MQTEENQVRAIDDLLENVEDKSKTEVTEIYKKFDNLKGFEHKVRVDTKVTPVR